MITILPMKDEAKKAAILSAYQQITGKADVIAMCEGEEEFGRAVIALDGTVLKIYDIIVNGQEPDALDMMGKMTADSLMRSAASYGEHFGADRIEAYVPALADFLQRKGFKEENGCMATPMSTIVHYSHKE